MTVCDRIKLFKRRREWRPRRKLLVAQVADQVIADETRETPAFRKAGDPQ